MRLIHPLYTGERRKTLETIIVTRHRAQVSHIRELGLAGTEAPVVAHVKPEEIQDKHVVGVLPLHLAALAAQVTVVPLFVPQELRGVELSLDQVRQYSGEPATYVVTQTA